MNSRGLKRTISLKEKVVLLVLVLLIIGWTYYLVVDQPVRNGIKNAKIEAETLSIEADAAEVKADNIRYMLEEMNRLKMEGYLESYIPSYNASSAELSFLNDTLSKAEDYYIGFSELTRTGQLIRRSFSLQYRASDYDEAIVIMREIENSENRCLISDFSVSPASNEGTVLSGAVQVTCQAIFFETTYDGIVDADLPEDPEELAAQQAAAEAALEELEE